MNQDLWHKILTFDFDNPPSEYCFSIRLAAENSWTRSFTEQAIVEYKKFMYLAATSEAMVSPSEIVDVVWHQHLIFTQSYRDFCLVLGKNIQHLPSTHSPEEFQKFKEAKERTSKLYQQSFGDQPKNFWNVADMFSSLGLTKAKFKIRSKVIIGLLVFIIAIFPFTSLFRPTYEKIDNPDFALGFIALAILAFVFLEFYNRFYLKKMMATLDQSSFLSDLHPSEVIFSKTQKLATTINGVIDPLIQNQTVKLNDDNTLELIQVKPTKNLAELQIIHLLTGKGAVKYENLVHKLIRRPIFKNIAGFNKSLERYIIKSKSFSTLFFTDFIILTLLFMVSFSRFVLGIMREVPSVYILVITLVFGILIAWFLNRLCRQFTLRTLPNWYKFDLLPSRQLAQSPDWLYFLIGVSALAPPFQWIAGNMERTGGYMTGDLSLGGGNCGGSGGSCGSCGGGGSGCGGCGGCGS